MPKLLITDDAAIIREMIKDTAERAGFTVVGLATDGREAVEMFRALRPDVMTLDMVMPKFDGRYALENILGEFPSARIVVVSAVDQKPILREAFKLGATDFVVKPFDKRQLIDTLTKAVATAAKVDVNV